MITQATIQGMLNDLARNDVFITTDTGAPTDGTSGTGVGVTGKGSVYINYASGEWYINTGTKASPAWKLVTHA